MVLESFKLYGKFIGFVAGRVMFAGDDLSKSESVGGHYIYIYIYIYCII